MMQRAFSAALLGLLHRPCAAAPLRVFVFAGQSNMEGQAEVATVDKQTRKPLNGTLKYQLTDPRTAAEFAPTWDKATSNWTVLPNIKVWYNEAGETLGTNTSKIPGVAGVDYTAGSLSVGFGSAGNPNLIGPEFGFGFGMQAAHPGEKMLIIKTAWGGKTIAEDFRPPSSVADPQGKGQWPTGPNVVGHYYTRMMTIVQQIMSPGVIAKMFPDLAGLEPQISGFGWFQGWNDGCSLNQTAAYEANMVNLIKDIRKAWKKPALPVTIAASGFDGFYGEEKTVTPPGCFSETPSIKCNCANDRGCRRLDIVRSQFNAANATRHPELGGHVVTMETRGFWRDAKYSPNHGQGYHFWHNAETYYLIGKAMAKGMLSLLGPK